MCLGGGGQGGKECWTGHDVPHYNPARVDSGTTALGLLGGPPAGPLGQGYSTDHASAEQLFFTPKEACRPRPAPNFVVAFGPLGSGKGGGRAGIAFRVVIFAGL